MSCKLKNVDRNRKMQRSKADLEMMEKYYPLTPSNWGGSISGRTSFDTELQTKYSAKVDSVEPNIKVETPNSMETYKDSDINYRIETPKSTERYNLKNYEVRDFPKNYPKPVKEGFEIQSPLGNPPQDKYLYDVRTDVDEQLQSTWCPYKTEVPIETPDYAGFDIETPKSVENFQVYQQNPQVPPLNQYIGKRSSFDVDMNQKYNPIKEGFNDYLASFNDPDNNTWSFLNTKFQTNINILDL